MQKTTFIGAGLDLGVHIDGARLGPRTILKKLNFNHILLEQKENIIKSHDELDLKKNLEELNNFNKELYTTIKKENRFCLTIGGDHSIAIASSLASLKKHGNLGIIWIDSHLDYNTFKTTITGNLHGLPLASLNGLNKELSIFHDGNYFNPKNTVVVGYRAFEQNANLEIENIKTMGVTVYTTEDIKKYGVQKIMDMAFMIASNQTDGIHVSFDLDVIDPNLAPGVSVPEVNGINQEETDEILTYLSEKKKIIKSFDLVEYNPLLDIENKTLEMALHIIKKITKD